MSEATEALEYYLPGVLRECHPEWRHESLDGVMTALANKLGDHEAEIYGLCILISDQTLAPLHLRIQVDAQDDTINWLECRLGEQTLEGMRRVAYDSPDSLYKKLHSMTLAANVDLIDWAYKITFGIRQAESS